MTEEPEINWSVEQDGDTGYLVVPCPDCGTKNRYLLSGIKGDGSALGCTGCDSTFAFHGPDLAAFHAAIEDVGKGL